MSSSIISATKYWLETIVIGFNFCPFAKREFVRNSIQYQTVESVTLEDALYQLLDSMKALDSDPSIETTLLIFSRGFNKFDDYLDLLELSNQLLVDEGYEGTYQLASFHPNYCFEGVDEDDASNYTNRSPYPILHLLREESLEKVLDNIEHPESIPERNIELAQQKGRAFFEKILEKSFHQ